MPYKPTDRQILIVAEQPPVNPPSGFVYVWHDSEDGNLKSLDSDGNTKTYVPTEGADFLDMPSVDGVPLVESGSNSDGSWFIIRPLNIMVAYGSVNFGSHSSGDTTHDVDFPVSFDTTPLSFKYSINHFSFGSSDTPWTRLQRHAQSQRGSGTLTASSDHWQIRLNFSSSTNSSTGVQWIAVGAYTE